MSTKINRNKYMNPEVSIIIPVFKTEKVICRCLDSLKKQTFQNFEIIVVDDCSPDNAMSLVSEYSKEMCNINILRHEENKGLMYTRRTGYQVASGKYIVFLDSDDTLPEDALQILVENARNTDADIVISGFRYIWEDTGKIKNMTPSAIGVFTPEEVYYKLLNEVLRHNLAFCIFKSSLFKNEYYTIPNQTNGEDFILFCQLVEKSNKIKVINEVTYNYYQEADSSTKSPMTVNKLCQIARVNNFEYRYLVNLGIDKDVVIKNVIGAVHGFYSYPFYREAINILDDGIKKHLNYFSVIRYLNPKQIIKFTFYRLKNLLGS